MSASAGPFADPNATAKNVAAGRAVMAELAKLHDALLPRADEHMPQTVLAAVRNMMIVLVMGAGANLPDCAKVALPPTRKAANLREFAASVDFTLRHVEVAAKAVERLDTLPALQSVRFELRTVADGLRQMRKVNRQALKQQKGAGQ